MAYSPNSNQPKRPNTVAQAMSAIFAHAEMTNDQKTAVLGTLAGLLPQAAALLWQTSPNDLHGALAAASTNGVPNCTALFPNDVPAMDTTLISTSAIADFSDNLQAELVNLLKNPPNNSVKEQAESLKKSLNQALYKGLGSVRYDLSSILFYINASCTLKKAKPATDHNKFSDGTTTQSVPYDSSHVEPLLKAAGFTVLDGMVTLTGNPTQFAFLLQHAWTVYLHSQADGEAKLRRIASRCIPNAKPAETSSEEAPLPEAAPAPQPAPTPAQKATPKVSLADIYRKSKPLDIQVKLALIHILGDLTKDVEMCEWLWAAVREAHQAAGITPERFVACLSYGEDIGKDSKKDGPAKILEDYVTIVLSRDPYRQLDIPAWFKYLRFGGSRVASRVGGQVTAYADDQDEFFTYYNVLQDVNKAYLDAVADKGRYLHCDYTGYLIAAAKARNLTSHNAPDSVDQITLDNLMYYLKGWVNSIAPLCEGTPWQFQSKMALCRQNLLNQFYRALDTVSYRVDTLLDYLNIALSDQPKAEQLLHEAGLQVADGFVDVMGDVERFAEALKAAWDLACTDWEAGALELQKYILQTRQQIESQKLNMEALRMDMLLELTKSDDPQTQLEAMLEIGKRHWNVEHRNAKEAGHWFKMAVRFCPTDPEANYLAACYYLDRDCKATQSDLPEQRSSAVTGDAEEAVTHLRTAADALYAPAQVLLGQCYEKAHGIPYPDKDAAFKLYQQAAQQHNADGLYHLGRCYEKCIGTHEDLTEAFYCYKEAAMQNHPDARCGMARSYVSGFSVRFDYERAVQIYEELVQEGHVQAMVELANCYSTTYSISTESYPAQPQKARNLYMRAAQLGRTDAMIKLASDHYWDSSSLRWLIRAAEAGDKEGQYLLAQTYHEGGGVQKTPTEAFRWYLAAAEQRHPLAVEALIECYANGYGTTEDLSKAIHWCYRADPDSLYGCVASLHDTKSVVQRYGKFSAQASQQLAEAFQKLLERVLSREHEIAYSRSGWSERAIQKVIDKDNFAGVALARYMLGECCEQGYGTEAAPSEAFQWYRKAAASGLMHGMWALARCYEQGIGSAIDMHKAAEYYRKAAEAGHAQAQYEWARCLDAGIGTDPDVEQALAWHQRAAERGIAQSQYIWARHLQPTDPEAAHKWYCAAAEQAHAQAALKASAYYAAHSLDHRWNVKRAWQYCVLAFFPGEGSLEFGRFADLNVQDGIMSETPELFRDAVAEASAGGESTVVSDLTPQERELIEAVLQYREGYCHMISCKSPAQTVACYENAVRLGLQYGLVALGECYLYENGGVPEDPDKGNEYLRQATQLWKATPRNAT